MENMGLNKAFWKGKRVLITGHTGFKGSWLSIWLLGMGAQVTGYALPPEGETDNFVVSGLAEKLYHEEGDIREESRLLEVFKKHRPEIVFHLAAQPLVRLSYEKPRLTYETNVIGTLNVLEAIRQTPSVKSALVVTTDKCYENKETVQGYRETDPLGGYDPYSSSKACAEILTASYRSSYFSGEYAAAIASARAGNVIGGGDWAKDRIVPDCIRAIQEGKTVRLRNPGAVRPWQFVLEPLSGYLMLAQRLWEQPLKYTGGWNFGPEETVLATVKDIADMVVDAYGHGTVETGIDSDAPHEAGLLCLNIAKAKQELGWRPVLDLGDTVRMTVEWYRDYKQTDPYELCRKQIREFEEKNAVRG